jgi:tetratricopeptide (TPR) repeat protein
MTQDASKDFFISYNKADQAWAEWIAWQLEAEGYNTVLQAWDFLPGSNFVLDMDQAAKTARRTIVLLSPDYLVSSFTRSEWAAAFAQDPTGAQGKLLPIRVRACTLSGLLAQLVYIDLVDLDEPLAQAALRAELTHTRLRPTTAPNYPGSVMSTPRTSPFPGPRVLPQVWNVPLRRNPFFTGRESVFTELHTLLHAGTKTALSQPPAISGLGGIGKTQMAVEYAFRAKGDYQFVLWVQANSQETLLADFVTLAKELDLFEQNEREQQIVVHAVLQWLETHCRWLLIFDNADDLAMVQDYLPQGNQGHILFTTRAQALAGLAHKIELETMDPKEGVILLLRRAGLLSPGSTLDSVSTAEYELAHDIVLEMGGLPLALDQAGAYLEETGESLSNYLSLYQQHRSALLNRRGGFRSPHPESVATTLSLALQQVERDQPAAVDLMHFCALLAPDAIPEELIIEGANYLGPVLQTIAVDRTRLNETLATLLKYSLLRRDGLSHTLIIHRLVQAVILDELDNNMHRSWAECVVRVVSHVFPFDESPPWPHSQRYLAQALVCESLIRHWDLILAEAVVLLNHAGLYLIDRGQYEAAEPLLQDALTVGEKKYSLDHPDTAQALNSLALLYANQGRYEEAEPLYQRALAIKAKSLGPEHPNTAKSLNNLSGLYWKQDKYEEAELLIKRALSIKEKIFGRDHSDTATTLNNMALLYKDQGKHKKAEKLFHRALTIKEKILGPEHPDTAYTLHNLATLYKDQGKYKEAEQLFHRALAIREQMLGPEHPNTARTLNNLATLYKDQGMYQEAEPLYHRALAIFEKRLGPKNPDKAIAIHNLATLYKDQGKYEEARPLYQRALAIREQTLGPDHLKTKCTRENHAALLDKMEHTATSDASITNNKM